MTLDPAALQILISRLTGIAEEMGAVLQRAAFSPNIKERADCSSALFTPEGELRWNVPGFTTEDGAELGRVAFGPDNVYYADNGLWGVQGCGKRGVRQGGARTTGRAAG